MRKLVFILIISFLLGPFSVSADRITLDSAENLAVPTSRHIANWHISKIDPADKILRVRYQWATDDNKIIKTTPSGWNTWDCRDIEVPGENINCTAAGEPWACCTGNTTGTCDDMVDTCFTDVFGFTIRAQDVGTSIGSGLKTLIWNRMKQDILSETNNGTFD